MIRVMPMREINIKKIPAGALEIIEVLEMAGYEAWLVGGCVRDLLMDRVPEDWDITTLARPEDVLACFPHTVSTGIAHGTVTVLHEGAGYEVTTYRSETGYSDFRRPDTVDFVVDICEDLARRDFTINALAWHPDRGLSDCFMGAEDLAEGVIRAVGVPVERFGEDALRMLRAVRFAAQLDFEIDPETLGAIRLLAGNIRYVSSERIRTELDKWLLARHSRRWPLLKESGLMAWVLPELEACFEVPQHTPWHTRDVGGHTLEAAAYAPPLRAVRWALLLHDIGKAQARTTDAAGIDHFHGHEQLSAMMARDILERLRWDRATERRILNLIHHHDWAITPEPAAVRRGIRVLGEADFEDWLAVRRADLMAQNPDYAVEALDCLKQVEACYRWILQEGQCTSLAQLAVSGRDLLAEGIPQGPEVGRLLKALLDWVIEDPERNRRERLLHEVKMRNVINTMSSSKDQVIL